ncbi:hypothetical protein Pd630_LPD09133 (plasmid) [Rhodococcus opacus PD630]|nr:hypothetical protein Pd630_LPD09133 [Rhodococcus opacus PD630]
MSGQRKIVHTAAAASATTTTHIAMVRKCSLSARSCCRRRSVRFGAGQSESTSTSTDSGSQAPTNPALIGAHRAASG